MQRHQPDEWPTSGSEWLRPVPWGLRELLNWVQDEYNLPIYITENGVSTLDVPGLEDETRVTYYRAYVNEILKGKLCFALFVHIGIQRFGFILLFSHTSFLLLF